MNLPLHKIDKSWTLFLDRDGVINHEKQDDYIHTWDEFTFYEGATEAIKIFTKKFNKILVVTNQRGVGKGLTKLDDLHTIHANMLEEIERSGGHLDAIYYCSELDNDNPYRKPNPGMGLKLLKNFQKLILIKRLWLAIPLAICNLGVTSGYILFFFQLQDRK